MDSEKKFIDTNQKILMSTYNEISKNSGYYEYNYRKKSGSQLLDEPYSFSYPKKARLKDKIAFAPYLDLFSVPSNSKIALSKDL